MITSIIISFGILLNFLILGVFGRRIGAEGSKRVTYTLLAFVNIWYITFFFFEKEKDLVYTSTILKNWVNVGELNLEGIFLLDGLSQILCLLLIIVSSIIHIYSFYYMENDPNLIKFVSYLSFFTFSMILLSLSENLFLIFSAWECIGISSFLLIGFWSTRRETRKGSIKAVILNRVGDCCIIAAMGLAYTYTGSNSLHTIFSVLPYNYDVNWWITILFFIGCIAKSTQIFLHIWLLQAMEGPTPVSALLHSSSLVCAGIYLFIRLSYLFEYTDLTFIPTLSLITIFYAASTAVLQNDIKRIIAYSTLSQLGYMLAASTLSAYNIGLFHLFTHGFFKSFLFLSAGLVIHALKEEQDIRKMGGLFRVLPITYTFFLIGSFAIVGLPFMSAFYSKDAVLEIIASSSLYFLKNSSFPLFAIFLAFGGVFFTTFYSLRLLYYVFLSKPNGFKSYYNNNFFPKEAPNIVILSMSILALGSIFFGYLFKPLFSNGTSFLLFSIYNKNAPFLFEHYSTLFRILPSLLILSAFFFLWSQYSPSLPSTFSNSLSWNSLYFSKEKSLRRFYNLLISGYYIDFYILKSSWELLKGFKNILLAEKAFLEHFGPYGLRRFSIINSRFSSFLHLNRNYRYFINIHTLIIVLFTLFIFLI